MYQRTTTQVQKIISSLSILVYMYSHNGDHPRELAEMSFRRDYKDERWKKNRLKQRWITILF